MVETGRFAVHTDLRIARDRRNLIVRGFAALHPPDDFEFTIRSDIPLSGGLGTSAAAIVAGLRRRRLDLRARRRPARRGDARWRATRTTSRRRCSAASCSARTAHAERFEPPPAWSACWWCPTQAVRTAKAREALPARDPGRRRRVQHRATPRCSCSGSPAATSGWSRAGSATASTSRAARTSTRARGSWSQRARELGALGATISGAGPTVLVWCDFESTGAVAARLRAEVAEWAEVLRVPFRRRNRRRGAADVAFRRRTGAATSGARASRPMRDSTSSASAR